MTIQSSKNLRRLNCLLGELDAAYHEASRKRGISDSVCKILYAICDAGENCLLQEVRRQTGLSKQTLNSALRGLEERGVIYLEAADGKSKRVCLTEEGKRFAQETALCIIQIENEIFDAWPQEDVLAYLELTQRLLEDFRQRSAALEERNPSSLTPKP